MKLPRVSPCTILTAPSGFHTPGDLYGTPASERSRAPRRAAKRTSGFAISTAAIKQQILRREDLHRLAEGSASTKKNDATFFVLN